MFYNQEVENNLADAYAKLICRLDASGEVVESPAWNTRCKELTGVVMCVKGGGHKRYIPKFGVHTPSALRSYIAEMLDGTLDWAVHAGKEAYTYHDRMSGQWREALDILRKDSTSRRAVITIRTPDDVYIDDQPCLTTVQLLVRNGALDMLVYFRSNDLFQATYLNAYALMELQNRWAQELGIPAGYYMHVVGSLHVYEKDWGRLRSATMRIIESISSGPNIFDDLCYTEDEFWEADE